MTLEEAMAEIKERMREAHALGDALNGYSQALRSEEEPKKSVETAIEVYATEVKIATYKECLRLLGAIDGKEEE